MGKNRHRKVSARGRNLAFPRMHVLNVEPCCFEPGHLPFVTRHRTESSHRFVLDPRISFLTSPLESRWSWTLVIRSIMDSNGRTSCRFRSNRVSKDPRTRPTKKQGDPVRDGERKRFTMLSRKRGEVQIRRPSGCISDERISRVSRVEHDSLS